MGKEPKIPMSAEELPQQRINEVVDLPPRPEGLEIEVGYGVDYEAAFSVRLAPRLPVMLVQVEWAESPVNYGLNAFYIEGRRRHWLLWNRWFDENDWTPRWRWSLSGYCARKNVERKTAGIHLLLAFWAAEKGTADGEFDWINEEGLLSVEDVRAMARIALAAPGG
jgi:hypothetical protein